jgi:hypothetical protein
MKLLLAILLLTCSAVVFAQAPPPPPPAPPAPPKTIAPPGKSKFAVPRGPDTTKRFEVELKLKNGHIGSVFIGCREGATDGMDRRVDDMAPPPGIGGVGYTFLISPDRRFNLYKDIRAYGDVVQWLFYAKVGGKPVTVSWAADAVPKGYQLYCGLWDGKSKTVADAKDCRKVTSMTLEKTGTCRFWLVKDK